MRRGFSAVLLVLALLAASCGSDDSDAGGDGGAAGATTTTTVETTATGDTQKTDADDAADAEPASQGTGWLFVLQAEGGTSDGSTLSLTGVDADLVVFGDRPARRAERLPTAALVDDWATLGFDEDPPNAAVTVETDEGPQTAVVVLRDPSFDAGSGTLTFATEPVDGEGGELLGFGGSPVDALPASFGRATVFVDVSGGSAQSQQGEIEVFGVPEGDYDIEKEKAQQAGHDACWSVDQLEICHLLEWDQTNGLQWSLGAALLEGQDAAQSSVEMTVVYPGEVYAKAVSPVENTDSKWLIVDWMKPYIDVPGVGVELEAVVQIGGSAAVTVSCVVPQRPVTPNDLFYYCFEGTQ